MSAEIDEYPSLRFQDIRKKTKCHGRTHGRTDNVKTVYPTTNKVCGGINIVGGINIYSRILKTPHHIFLFSREWYEKSNRQLLIIYVEIRRSQNLT